MDAVGEEWRLIHEGAYAVSNLGRVKRVRGGQGARVGIISPQILPTGYLNVSICINGQRWTERIHMLVSRAFLGDPPTEKPYVDHVDGNKQNNTVQNLEYVSSSENQIRARRMGLIRRKGDRRKPLSSEEVSEIKLLKRNGVSQTVIATRYGIDQGHVSKIVNGRIWRTVQ